MRTQGLAHVALTPHAPPTNPAWSSRPAHPQALLGHQRAKRGPRIGVVHADYPHPPSAARPTLLAAGRVRCSQPVSDLTQVRPALQDSGAGETSRTCAV